MAVNINIPSQVTQTITDGVTTTAPSENAVFDALALKANEADLALVATTGDYNDLDNLPIIPDVSGLVPYTGAVSDVDLGQNALYTEKVFLYDGANDNYGSLHYTDGNFHIEDGDGHPLIVVEDGFIQIHKDATIQSNLYTSGLTAIRDHYLPNESGTIALTSNIPSVDATPTDGSANAVSSNGVFDGLALKQATLVSGTNIKTINSTSLLGSGDVAVQPTLVSGTSIKTINGTSLLGSGDIVVGAASGIFGIANTSGVYTYYATLTLAMAAATSGQTIVMFANVTETGAVQINLKNGVNINFNGHTYTLNSAGTSNAFSDNNVAVTVKLMNGTINRIGGTNTGGNSFTLDIINTSTNIDATGMKFISSFSLACRLSDGTLTGGFYSGFTTGISISSGIAHNIYSFGQTSDGIGMNGGELSNSKSLSNGRYGMLINGGIITNCYSKSTANSGALCQGGTINNSTFISTSSSGLWCYSGSPIVNQCLGYSTASVGVQIETSARVSNCNGYSTVNKGINVSTNNPIYNCIAESVANVALSSAGNVYNCTAKSYWNNASGHAMSGNNPEVFNCTLEVTNASANCLHNASAINVKFGSNTFKGATTQVNANITQGQTNLSDLYGNIKIG